MINRVVLIGRLTRDPEIRTTTAGKSVCEFSIAVDKRIKQGDNATDFFKVKAWGNQADYVANYLSKGRLVAIDGRLEQRRYQATDGGNREVIEVVAESVQGLDRPRDDAQPSTTKSTAQPTIPEDDFDPFVDE